MNNLSLEILYEDNHLLAVAKPAELPTMGVAPGKPSLLEAARDYIKEKYQKPGNVYLGIVSRLDAPVTGVVLLARTSKAAARLSEQFREREVDKLYWAVVEGVAPPSGEYTDWLAHHERHRKVLVVSPNSPGAQQARLSFRKLEKVRRGSLLEVKLETGRKHQIRVQLAEHSMPVLGDRKYGSGEPFSPGIALHARKLVVDHPVKHEPVEIVCPLPASWNSLGVKTS